MKVVILYQPNTELESSVNEYVREYKQETNHDIELIDSDSVQGAETAKIYDILQFPAIVALKDDGMFVEAWTERDKWPTVSELSFYNQ